MWVYSGDGNCAIYRFNGEMNTTFDPAFVPHQYNPVNAPFDGNGNAVANVFNAPSGNTLSMD